MSRMCVMFPNKRSARFFLKYLRDALPPGSTVVAPATVTVSDFVQMLAGRVINSRIDSLMVLYRCWCRLRGLDAAEQGEAAAADFEHFRTWGETMLADFDEVDLYAVNPDSIFKNVKDFREITSNFLTPDQRKVMAEYFGRPDTEVDPQGFWREFAAKDKDLSELKQKFVYLWETMGPLYHALDEALREEGLATMGGAYRLASEAIARHGRGLLPWDRMGIVGFNALSARELSIFGSLRDLEADGGGAYADFFWDATGPVLAGGDSTATRFVGVNRREFPSPAWAMPFIKKSDTRELPQEIKVISSPSASAQAKIVGEEIGSMARGTADPRHAFADAATAVVVPDESLLLPLLYSLPPDTGDVNLTMGYSLRLTSTSSFIALLRQCHGRQRKVKGRWGFHNADLKTLMAHPYSHLLFGSEAVGSLNAYISRYHPYAVTPEEMRRISPQMAEILTPLGQDSGPGEVADYLEGILLHVRRSMEERGNDGLVKSRLDVAHIDTYRDALRRLRDALTERGIRANFRTVLTLADRLLAAEKVNFEGEPLRGLQVMGLLETRSLDFDTLVIPSMNEKIMPLKARRRTFIPDTLRVGYGMPPSNFQESLFAYYFYRLISRARRVVLLYDSRTSGLGGGDPSRYVQQLRYLFAKGRLLEQERRFSITGREVTDADVAKDRDVMRRLDGYTQSGSGKNLSASALRTYCNCQARFFYESVLGLRTEEDSDQYMDPATQGTVLHNVIMSLYLPRPAQRERLLEPGLEMTADRIQALIDDTEKIDTLLRRTINRVHFHLDETADIDRPLSGETELVAGELRRQVQAVLRHDLGLAPFTMLGCEIREVLPVEVGGHQVNINMAIDRLDMVRGADGSPVLRVIDYKTGNVHLEAKDMDSVFGPDRKASNILQLLFYAWMLQRMGFDLSGVREVRTEIYDVKTMAMDPANRRKDEGDGSRLPAIGGVEVSSYAEVSGEFERRMTDLIDGIWDTSRPFAGAADPDDCTYCPLRTLCNR